MDMPAQTDVVQYRHAAENFNFLKCPGNAKLGPLKRPECVDFLLFIKNISSLGRIKSVNDIHHHCLAGAVRTDYRMDLAFSDFQIDTGQGTYFPEKHVDIMKFKEDILFISII